MSIYVTAAHLTYRVTMLTPVTPDEVKVGDVLVLGDSDGLVVIIKILERPGPSNSNMWRVGGTRVGSSCSYNTLGNELFRVPVEEVFETTALVQALYAETNELARKKIEHEKKADFLRWSKYRLEDETKTTLDLEEDIKRNQAEIIKLGRSQLPEDIKSVKSCVRGVAFMTERLESRREMYDNAVKRVPDAEVNAFYAKVAYENALERHTKLSARFQALIDLSK